jgi:thiol-disulfide isomerase/thioredoxin
MRRVSRARLVAIIGSSVRWASAASLVGSICLTSVQAADRDAQVVKALSYAPRQTNITYDKVGDKEIDSCTGKYETRNGFEGLVIYNAAGQPLRRFSDSNGDRQVDQWCYYKDGIEVYRDIDSDFNGAADQYRWLGTAGTRWGLDKNEDGKIDQWKIISAEEVTMEVVEAIKARDEERFKKLLVSDAELKTLGLGDDKGDQLTTRLANARKTFAEFARTQKMITANTKWAHFAADKPGVVPEGTEGALQDIVAYENSIAIVDNDGTSQQLMVGTLVQIGNAWRLADVPRTVADGDVLSDSGLFFPAAASNRIGNNGAPEGGISPELQGLLTQLEKSEAALKENSGDRVSLHEDRANILQRLVVATKGTDEMELWVKQLADSASSAAQAGEYPEGVRKLRELESQLANMPRGKTLIPYVAYRLISTDYALRSTEEKADFNKLQRDYMDQLQSFVEAYPEHVDAADAMIQLGLNHELSGGEGEQEALTWYKKVATRFPDSPQGRKASGAIARLTLEGRTFKLSGKTLDGKTLNSNSMIGSPILVHYWASWCGPCKEDMAELRNVQAKYARQNLNIIGVNLDTDPSAAIAVLKKDKAFPWQHLNEEKGFDSDLAIGLGVLSVPVTILIDGEGKVVKRTSHFSKEMEKALEQLLADRAPQTQSKPPVTPQAVKAPANQTPDPRKAQQPDARKAQQPTGGKNNPLPPRK